MSSSSIYVFDDMDFAMQSIPINVQDHIFVNLISLIHTFVLKTMYIEIENFNIDKFIEGKLFKLNKYSSEINDLFKKKNYNLNEYIKLYNLFKPKNLCSLDMITPFKNNQVKTIKQNIEEFEQEKIEDFDKNMILIWKEDILNYVNQNKEI